MFDAFNQKLTKFKRDFAWGDDPELRKIKANVPVYYYGTREDMTSSPQHPTDGARFRIDAIMAKTSAITTSHFTVNKCLNSLAVIAVSHLENYGKEVARELADFKGVKRRFTERKLLTTN